MKGPTHSGNLDRSVQLPGIHAMVNNVASTSDALERLRNHHQGQRLSKIPKLEHSKRLAQGSLPVPSFTDTSGHTVYPDEFKIDSIPLPIPVEPSYKDEINSNYYKYWDHGLSSPVIDPQGGQPIPGQGDYITMNGHTKDKLNGLNGHNAQSSPHTNGGHPNAGQANGTGSLYTNDGSNHLRYGSDSSIQSLSQSGRQTSPLNQSVSPPGPNSSSSHSTPVSAPEDEPPVRRRTNLPKGVTKTLRDWLDDHVDNPYPSEEDKHRLMQETGLTLAQVSNWFINARRRVLNSSQRKAKYRNIRTVSYSPDEG